MRVVVYGAGAIGGVLGARLHRAGHHVTLIARGEHLRAIRRDGLVFTAPDGTETLRLAATDDPADLRWDEPTAVILSVKSQSTAGALGRLAVAAPPETPVVCAQNGVDNERQTLRYFPHTYPMCVLCPASHLQPGVVRAHSSPVTGIMDVGRYPDGVDGFARQFAGALRDATFESVAVPDIMRWKYRKLLVNLANAVEALAGPEARGSELAAAAHREGEAVLRAAAIPVASPEEDAERRGDRLSLGRSGGDPWRGGSSWQSVARGAGSIEADFLNGEITLLGRLHGVPTPVNEMLLRRATDLVRRGDPPGSADPDALLAAAHAAV